MPQRITHAERIAAIRELEDSRQRLLTALEGLTEEQWRLRPASNRWSIAECAEHITAAEVAMPKLLAAATAGEASDSVSERDDFVRRSMRDRTRHDQAPENLRPRGRWATGEETIRVFEERRAANLDFVQKTQEDLRGRFFPHPLAGILDCYQWLVFLAAHTDRHAEQIEETRRVCGA